jgi:hypothetical protein
MPHHWAFDFKSADFEVELVELIFKQVLAPIVFINGKDQVRTRNIAILNATDVEPLPGNILIGMLGDWLRTSKLKAGR